MQPKGCNKNSPSPLKRKKQFTVRICTVCRNFQLKAVAEVPRVVYLEALKNMRLMLIQKKAINSLIDISHISI
jgi:hypothetical protein